MIKEVRLSDNKINFCKKAEENKPSKDSRIEPNTLETRVRQKLDKTANAFIEYPYKGFKGDVNSDFYEFLAMGIVPYLVGSAMFMGLFNLVNKHLDHKSGIFAGNKGKKMALGVVLYGVGKTLANDLVTRPVAWSTGVDIEMPYTNVYNPLPTMPGASADIKPKRQARKVYDSIEFFRKDLIANDPRYGVSYYDNIAKKLGMGDNLNDSVTETTPIIQSIVASTKTAKSLSSYAWAAAGVGLAMQNSWGDFFDAISQRRKHIAKSGEGLGEKLSARMSNAGHNFVDISKTFCSSFTKACKSMWSGEAGTSGYMKHAGKALILFASALTIGSVANVIIRAKSMGKLANKDLMDREQESTVI